MMPFSIERMVLSRPEMPAAGSECPILLLICPAINQGSGMNDLNWSIGLTLKTVTEPIIRGSS